MQFNAYLVVKKTDPFKFYRFVQVDGDKVILDRGGAYFSLDLEDFNKRYIPYLPPPMLTVC